MHHISWEKINIPINLGLQQSVFIKINFAPSESFTQFFGTFSRYHHYDNELDYNQSSIKFLN